MSRPYMTFGIVGLRALFEGNKENEPVLEQIIEELAHRKTNGARVLLSAVSLHLAEFVAEDGQTGHVDCENASESQPDFRRTRPEAQVPNEASTFASHPDDLHKPKQLAQIRPPGTAGLPDAYQRSLKREISLPVTRDSDPPIQYIAALNALIREIRKSGSGQKRYELEKGKRLESAGGNIFYEFQLNDEADLFEDAQVELQIAGRRVEGSIVSISAGRLIISVGEELGVELRDAVLLIDATALLEALVKKVEQVKQGELTLNRNLADAIVGYKEEPESPTTIPGRNIADLNESQIRAYEKALSAAVTWIWGPPGCGKTKILGEIVRSAFEDGRRVLVCSNTNKAVDQVLYRICEALGTEHKAMEEGRVLRLGHIADDKLNSEYAAYVTIDGIIDRRSKELNIRRRKIEEEISGIDGRSELARELLARFESLDRADRVLTEKRGVVNNFARESKQVKRDFGRNKSRVQELEAELEARKKVFLGLFKRSKEAIQSEIRTVEMARPEIEKEVLAIKKSYDASRTNFDTAVADRDQKKKDLASENRSTAERLVTEAKKQRDPLVSELSEIEEKISALRKSVIDDARVLGATCTKTYLSVKDIGQFDIVIIDEASTVMLPMAWLAAGLSRERVVICGDFRQIPPIVQTEQESIFDILARDVFDAAGVKKDQERLMMLDTQYRMDPEICGLISEPMYQGRLHTFAGRTGFDKTLPAPFDRALTIIDTSDLWPFESQNAFFSRFNLMHALLARNLIWHFEREGAIANDNDLGVCTPYSSQAKLIQKILEGERLDQHTQVGTVHRFQGDERRIILLDIPESYGGSWNLGQFVQGLPPDHVGARLINVAVSRAQDHFIVMANLTYLDKKLPSSSLLRSVLFDVQEKGKVVSGTELLRLRPIESDLKDLIGQMPFEEITETLGIFDEKEFERALKNDIHSAKESIVIFSGYITPSRAGSLGDLFRSKISEGVQIRCVTRPPQTNGSIPPDEGRAALDMLEGIGVIVDCRAKIHQKICLIDKRIVWMGSLNALSHAGRSDETMTRIVNEKFASAIAAQMSKRKISASKAAGTVADAENPRCPDCESRTVYREGRYGPYHSCEAECGWKQNQRSSERTRTGRAIRRDNSEEAANPQDGPPCPDCGSKTKITNGRFGLFYGCIKHPTCTGSVSIKKS
jgi:superfamily I DNA and/or RNA helicase